jgi:hypothetical protein
VLIWGGEVGKDKTKIDFSSHSPRRWG